MKLTRRVVEDAEDPAAEIDLEEAQQYESDARIGQDFVQELTLEDLGRNAIAAAKQVLVQRVREAERERIYEDYHDRVGEMVRGTVQQVDRGNIYVKLDRSEAILPPREQIARDRYHQGDHIKAYIIAVDKLARGRRRRCSRRRSWTRARKSWSRWRTTSCRWPSGRAARTRGSRPSSPAGRST